MACNTRGWIQLIEVTLLVTRLHSVFCLTTGPSLFPQPVLHRARFNASSFSFQYPIVSSRSSSSCLLLPPCLRVPSIFPSVTYIRRQFLYKIRPIQLAFLLYAVCMMVLSYSSTCNTSSFLYVCCMYDGPLLLVYM